MEITLKIEAPALDRLADAVQALADANCSATSAGLSVVSSLLKSEARPDAGAPAPTAPAAEAEAPEVPAAPAPAEDESASAEAPEASAGHKDGAAIDPAEKAPAAPALQAAPSAGAPAPAAGNKDGAAADSNPISTEAKEMIKRFRVPISDQLTVVKQALGAVGEKSVSKVPEDQRQHFLEALETACEGVKKSAKGAQK